MGNAASKGRDLMERRERTYTEHRRSGTLAMNLVCIFRRVVVDRAYQEKMHFLQAMKKEVAKMTDRPTGVFRALFEIENQNEPIPT